MLSLRISSFCFLTFRWLFSFWGHTVSIVVAAYYCWQWGFGGFFHFEVILFAIREFVCSFSLPCIYNHFDWSAWTLTGVIGWPCTGWSYLAMGSSPSIVLNISLSGWEFVLWTRIFFFFLHNPYPFCKLNMKSHIKGMEYFMWMVVMFFRNFQYRS